MLRSMLSPLVSINDALLTAPASKTDHSGSLNFLNTDAAVPFEKEGFVTTVVDTASFQSLFYDRIEQSKDKLFVIADLEQKQANRSRKNKREDWCVVQVDWDKTNQDDAITKGMYVVKRYVRHTNDALKVKSSQCRFWPEIREDTAPKATTAESNKADNAPVRRRSSASGSGPKRGLLHLVDPTKEVLFEKALSKWRWVHETVHLFEERLVGPFDFAVMDKQHHRISPKVWSELKSNVEQPQSSSPKKATTAIDLDSVDRKIRIQWSD